MIHEIKIGLNPLYTNRFARAFKRIYPRLGLRSDDVILAAYPKSGSTWLRFILVNIVSLSELGGKRIDYQDINGRLCAGYDSNRYGLQSFKIIPRFVVTHERYDDRKFGTNSILQMTRNPADVMVSFFEYSKAIKGPGKYVGSIDEFVRDPSKGIESWCKHQKSYQGKAIANVSYEQLSKEGFEVVKELFRLLNITSVKDEIIKEAIRRSSFDQIRKIEDTVGLDVVAKGRLESDFRFARKGKVGQWKEAVPDETIGYIHSVLHKYGYEKFLDFQ